MKLILCRGRIRDIIEVTRIIVLQAWISHLLPAYRVWFSLALFPYSPDRLRVPFCLSSGFLWFLMCWVRAFPILRIR